MYSELDKYLCLKMGSWALACKEMDLVPNMDRLYGTERSDEM